MADKAYYTFHTVNKTTIQPNSPVTFFRKPIHNNSSPTPKTEIIHHCHHCQHTSKCLQMTILFQTIKIKKTLGGLLSYAKLHKSPLFKPCIKFKLTGTGAILR